MRNAYAFTLTSAQLAEAALFRGRRHPLPRWMRPAMATTVFVLFGACGLLMTVASGQRNVPAKMVLVATLAILAAAILYGFIARRMALRPLRDSTYMAGSPRTLTLEDGGIRIAGAEVDAFHPWSAFRGMEEHAGTVHLLLDHVHFYPIPPEAFESDAERGEFMQHVGARIGSAPRASAPTHVPAPPADARPRRPSFLRTLLDAFRLAFFRDVPAGRMTRGWGWVLLFALLTVIAPTVVALWNVGFAGQWSGYLLPFAVFHVPLLLAAAVCAAYALGRRHDVPRIALAGVMIAFAIDLVAAVFASLAESIPNYQRLAMQLGWLPGAWLALALATYASRSVPPSERRLAVVIACVLVVALPLANAYRDRSLWQVPFNPDEDVTTGARSRMGIAGEDAFYKQPALLAQELQAVRPGEKGVVDVFFVGVAGYGPQDVFMKEVNAVSRLLRERFGAEGRAIRLVNNPKSILELPIASRTSMRAALKRVAEVMDKEEDVLVLFLTSHGSEKHRFSLTLWPMSFHELDPAALRSLLDESGIRNRVVIVSACYSGGFVKPLEDPNTLVITAAAVNRTSFGCTDTAEWTYFGRAYFDEALRTTYSFVRAFEIARPAITARERSGKFDPSEPQISVGAAIAGKLEQLEVQREGRAGAGPPAATASRQPPDKYRQYAQLVFQDDYLAEMRATCEQNMELSSPEASLRTDPGMFQGLDKVPAHWTRVKTAWASYAQTACARMNDPALVLESYVMKVREVMSEEDVTQAMALLATPRGQRWLAQDREAVRRQMLEVGRAQAAISSELYKKYVEELAAVFAQFQKKPG